MGADGSYALEGIGGSEAPENLHRDVIDSAERVSDEESFAMVRRLVREEGLLVGGSLCEITYTPIGKRRAWVERAQRIGVIVDELHRDEIPEAWGIVRTELPCVLARVGGAKPSVFLGREEIAAWRGSVEELARSIVAAFGG